MSLINAQLYSSKDLSLEWGKCTRGQWCPLRSLNLQHSVFAGLQGVYIIWHGGSNPRVVYVGKGAIAERLRAHRTSPEILQYALDGLFVTWSRVSPNLMDGVESYLVKALTPLENEQSPTAPPVAVTLPW